MKNLRLIIIFLLLVLINGCSLVKSVNKLGNEVYIFKENEWQGTWIVDDNALQIKEIDQNSGEIEIILIERAKLLKYRILLAQNGKDTFMNFIEKPEDEFYYPAKFKKNKNQLIVWRVSSDALEKAISKKKIDGEVTKHKYSNDVLITADKEKLNSFFINNRKQMLFDYEEPLILQRLVK